MNYIIINACTRKSMSCKKCAEKYSKLMKRAKDMKYESTCPGNILWQFLNRNNIVWKALLFIKYPRKIVSQQESFCLSRCTVSDLIYKLIL